MTSTNRVLATLGAVAVAVALVLPSQSIAQGGKPTCELDCLDLFKEDILECRGDKACIDTAFDVAKACLEVCES